MTRPTKRTQKPRRGSQRESVPSSPLRPLKRRKKASDPSPSQPPAVVVADDDDDDDDGDVAPAADRADKTSEQQLVSQIIPHLLAPDVPVQASKDHSNERHEGRRDGVQAYAQISARDWTYYVNMLALNIGRRSDPPPPPALDLPTMMTSITSTPTTTMTTTMTTTTTTVQDDESKAATIHIDLGPSKMVSRLHASVVFDDGKWVLEVRGRNGAKVNGVPLKMKDSHILSSGEVIEIGTVEMMFVLPLALTPLSVDPVYRQRAGLVISEDEKAAMTTAAASAAAAPAPPDPPNPAHQHGRNQSSQPAASVAALPPPPEHPAPGTPPPRIRAPPASPGRDDPAAATASSGISPGVDLSHDDNQHVKPQYSYAQLITQAIVQTPDGKLNLNGIYNFIMDNYAYYRHQQPGGWQNSIRHNLSLNPAFDKVARSTDEPGKGMKWHIVPESKDEMIRNAYRVGRGGHRGSSAPSSPGHLNYISHHSPKDTSASSRKRKAGSPVMSPGGPNTPANAANETPDRNRKRSSMLSGACQPDNDSPLPRARLVSAAAAGGNSSFSTIPHSPTLASSYLQEDSAPFVTPAPPKFHLKLAPPSTAQRPSQHMPTSSPAPFWRYADIGSTPLKPPVHFELSPLRPGGSIPPPQSSSPPPASRVKSPEPSPTRPPRMEAREGTAAAAAAAAISRGPEEPDEEQGFDLIQGFQSIVDYHKPAVRGVASSAQT